MRSLLFSLFVVSSLLAGSSQASTQRHILTFKVWKQKKIDEAKSIVAELKHQGHEDDEAKQADLNLGVARDLSANDYFLLYVAPQFHDNNDALIQAAKALTPRDIADILNAYQKRLQTQETYNSDSGSTPSMNDSLSGQEKTAKAP